MLNGNRVRRGWVVSEIGFFHRVCASLAVMFRKGNDFKVEGMHSTSRDFSDL